VSSSGKKPASGLIRKDRLKAISDRLAPKPLARENRSLDNLAQW
jgi:hypothetical protein